MAIIIEHMEMPNGCCECRMQTENCCTLSLKRIDDIFTRPSWCKLKEITCKDCKWYTPYRNIKGEEMGEGECEGYDPCVPANHYCSMGERKDGGENGWAGE